MWKKILSYWDKSDLTVLLYIVMVMSILVYTQISGYQTMFHPLGEYFLLKVCDQICGKKLV